MGESEESAGINLGKVGVGAREGMEYIVLGRGNNMCKKRELGLLRELKVVLCMTGNHIAKPGGGAEREPLETKAWSLVKCLSFLLRSVHFILRAIGSH